MTARRPPPAPAWVFVTPKGERIACRGMVGSLLHRLIQSGPEGTPVRGRELEALGQLHARGITTAPAGASRALVRLDGESVGLRFVTIGFGESGEC